MASSLVESATCWASSCGFDYPVLVDPSRFLYTYLGLRKTVVFWSNMPGLIRYAERMIAGIELRAMEGDDIHLMGGDFMVDSLGKLIFIFRTSTSNRPSVSELLTKLMDLDKSSAVHVEA